jgi:hypothetical protein
LNGFNPSGIAYSVSGLPNGASASSIVSGAFTVTAAAGLTAGSHPFIITGTSGSLVHAASAALVISPPPPPTFTISISPSSQSVTRPTSGSVWASYLVTITPQNGFTSPISLTPGGSLTGLTVTASSPTFSSGHWTSTLKAAVTTSALKATRTLTVTATGGGVSQSASATIQIN